MMCVGPKRRWGTWEELILGGAVLRHGNEDWYVVASELRDRTLFPSYFTPEVCKGKYEDLQKRYSGCAGWVEQLRKRRVAELKSELKKSEHSIGSLESMIKRLKERMTICNPPALDNTSNIQVSVSSKTGLNVVDPNSTPRKRRGKRKRRDCGGGGGGGGGEVKVEERRSFGGDIDNLGVASLSSSRWNETSTSECGQLANQYSLLKAAGGGGATTTTSANLVDLMDVFYSFVQNKASVVFRHRLDSQKRARYKKVIKQHMDFELIKSRIINKTIKSATELFRDLLLVANNAIIFYSKRSKEYKSALSLREDILKECRQHYKVSCNKATPLISSSMYSLPVKTWSARPRSCSSKRNVSVNIDRWGSPYRRIDVVDIGMQIQPLRKTNRGIAWNCT